MFPQSKGEEYIGKRGATVPSVRTITFAADLQYLVDDL